MFEKSKAEQQVIEMQKVITGLKAKNMYLEGECKELARILSMVASQCHIIYKFYPYVFKECCTLPELIKLFEIQDAFQNFIQKLTENNKKENGEDEI